MQITPEAYAALDSDAYYLMALRHLADCNTVKNDAPKMHGVTSGKEINIMTSY